MDLANRVIVVTESGTALGQALVERFARERPRHISVVDPDGAVAQTVADRVGGSAVVADLTCESEAARVIRQIEARHGAVDLFCCNGGVAAPARDQGAMAGRRQCWNVLGVLHHGPGDRLTFLRPVVAMPLAGGSGPSVRCLLRRAARTPDPANVADIVVKGLRADRFLVLTKPESKERALLRITHPDASLDGRSQPTSRA